MAVNLVIKDADFSSVSIGRSINTYTRDVLNLLDTYVKGQYYYQGIKTSEDFSYAVIDVSGFSTVKASGFFAGSFGGFFSSSTISTSTCVKDILVTQGELTDYEITIPSNGKYLLVNLINNETSGSITDQVIKLT